jgi:undecaprenyl-diphosphatase
MEINWLQSILLGCISGLTDILPVSAQAHQSILLNLFGIYEYDPLFGFAAMGGSLLVYFFAVSSLFKRIRKDYRLSRSSRRKRAVNMQNVFDMNLLRTACIPLILGLLLYKKVSGWQQLAPVLSLFLAVNGVVLYIPSYFAKGNKDSRSMSGLDSLMIGVGSVLGYVPGISRIAACVSSATLRGADPQQALKWGLLLSVPALLGMFLLEGYGILSAGLSVPEMGTTLKCLIVAVTSAIGTGIGIGMMKKLILRSGLEGFAYYCWGAALFSFILYMY